MLYRLRSFDLDQDQHPVKYVLAHLEEGIYESIHTWITHSVADSGDINSLDPRGFDVPAPWLIGQVPSMVCCKAASFPEKESVGDCDSSNR